MLKISTKEQLINDEIRVPQVRLIGENGEQLGIVTSKNALEQAANAGVDLVMISPKAEPPVCKIMDFGKFRFEQLKRDKEAKKNQRVVEIKEIRFSPKIDVNDFNVKLKAAHKFLTNGDKVKVSVRFRGREMAHTNMGMDLLKKFAESSMELCTVEKEPKLEGRQMIMFLAPEKKK